jgi:hypothetical protein
MGPDGLSPAFRYRSQPCLLSEYIDSLLWSYQFPARRPEQAWQLGRFSSSSSFGDYHYAHTGDLIKSVINIKYWTQIDALNI